MNLGYVRGPYRVRSASIRVPFYVRSGSALAPFRIRSCSGFVPHLFEVRKVFVGPRQTKLQRWGRIKGLLTAGTGFYITHPYRKCSTRLVQLASWPAGFRAVSWATGQAPWLARSGLNWLDLAAPGALAVSIWPRMARSACSWHPCWVDLAALCGPGRPTGSIWLPNECPIEAISQIKSICFSTIMFRFCLLRAL